MNKGYRFQFDGTDSKGTIALGTPSSVSYRWDHAPEALHIMPKHEFLNRQHPLNDENTATARAALERIHNG